MKKIGFYLLLSSQISLGNCAITYDFNGGRFGDCLSTYAKAKWFAHKHTLELLYKPFEYSDQLNMHASETLYNPQDIKQYKTIVKVKTEQDIKNNTQDHVLFVSNFYSITPDLYEYRFIDKKWEQIITTVLAPHGDTPAQTTHKDAATVALHVRKGGGFDQPLSTDLLDTNTPIKKFADQIWPTKFPPDEYYIQALQNLIKLLGPLTPVVVHLFTDDPHPQALAQKYKAALNNSCVEFIYRESGNAHNKNVVEDYYLMARCDYLIRSSSLLAKACQLLGDHKIIVCPGHGYWDGTKAVIDLVNIIMRNGIKQNQ